MVYNLAKTWKARGFYPQGNDEGGCVGVTMPLSDALPSGASDSIKTESNKRFFGSLNQRQSEKMEFWLDSNLGCCALEHSEVAESIEDALICEDEGSYDLITWCVMPSHLHVLMHCKEDIQGIVEGWIEKVAPSLKEVGRKEGLETKSEPEWGSYWSRKIKDTKKFKDYVMQVHHNPVDSGLCKRPDDWLWSSAWKGHHIGNILMTKSKINC